MGMVIIASVPQLEMTATKHNMKREGGGGELFHDRRDLLARLELDLPLIYLTMQ